MVWHVLKLHINGCILYISSFNWFFFHLPLFVRCILLVHVAIIYLFSLLYNIPPWIYHSLFFLSIFAHLHWFPHVAIINLLQWVFLAHMWKSFITASWTGNCWVEGHVYLQTDQRVSNCSQKWLWPFPFLPAMYENSSSFIFSSTLGITRLDFLLIWYMWKGISLRLICSSCWLDAVAFFQLRAGIHCQ